MRKTSPVTQKTLEFIADQKEHIEKIKALCGRISEYEKSTESKYEAMYLGADDMDLIKRALVCHMSILTLDVSRQEKALECGSEGGNLTSHSERHILEGCIRLLQEAGEYFREYLDFVGFEPDTEEEKLEYGMPYGHIVNRLFLFWTSHSGGTSTRAKCRELGVEHDRNVNIIETEDEEE